MQENGPYVSLKTNREALRRAATALTAQAERIAEMERENERLRDEAVQRVLDTPDGETIARALAEYGSAEAAVQEVENTKLIFERARAETAERALADAQRLAAAWQHRFFSIGGFIDPWGAEDEALLPYVTELEAALAAKAQAEGDAHYANGVANLAMKHRDTAEAQVAVLTSSLEQLISACTAERNPRYTYAPALDAVDAARTVLASLPDSAAKLREVVSEAERVSREHTGPLPDKHYILDMALDDLSKAVSAYKASRTGEDEL
jgi:hypothetical protein